MLSGENLQTPTTGEEPMLAVQLLGIPAIAWNDCSLSFSRRQARALLFRLAGAGAPVGRESLMDFLWPQKEPAVARRNLVRLLSLLRSELPDRELLLTNRTAVWLDTQRLRCDLHDFRLLSGSPLPGDWKTAVDLYRGPFLSGFAINHSPAFDDWQQSSGYDLERRYLETLAKLVKKSQANGQISEAITYANRYLDTDELAESIQRSLIALYAARGERTAALQQYSRCVDVLHRELGVEPLPETTAVFEAARDGQPFPRPLAVPQPGWSTLPGLDMPLTGRDSAWRSLHDAHLKQQPGGAILISGAPGIGKSRLMQEFASRQSSLVLVGNCHTGSQDLSFQPLVEALRPVLRVAEHSERVKPIWLTELAVLLPEIREQIPDLPPPLPLAPDQAQARLLEALTQVLRALAAHTPLLLCLDDLHEADEGTLAWLQVATTQLPLSRVCLLATYRAQEKQRLAEWQRTLSRAGIGAHIPLAALGKASVEALLQMAGATPQTTAVLAPLLHEATGGNAYFLLETIRELLESDGLQTAAPVVPLPQTVREAVLRRAHRLAPLSRQVLDMAAVLSPQLQVPLLAEASARSDLETAGALDDLVRRQILVPQGRGFRFLHDLTREAIYGAVSDWRLRLLHRRAARVLEQPSRHNAAYTAVAAAHYEAAGDMDEALSNYHEAAIEAQKTSSFQVAAAYIRSALRLLPQAGEPGAYETDLRERLGDCLRMTGQFADALEQYQRAVDCTSPHKTLALARIGRKMAETLWPMDRPRDAVAAGRQAAEELRPLMEEENAAVRREWVSIHLALAWSYYWLLELDGILFSLSEIEGFLQHPLNAEQKQRSQVYAALADFLLCRFRLSSHHVDVTRQHFELARQAGNPYMIAETGFRLGFTYLWSGDYVSAQNCLLESLRIAEELEVNFLWVQIVTYLMVAYRLMGNVAAVTDLMDQAWQKTEMVGALTYVTKVRAMRSWLAYRKNDMETAVSEARAAASVERAPGPFQWLVRWVLLSTALHDNRPQDAVEEARGMITPPQFLQEKAVNEALETAVSLWDRGHCAAAQKTLSRAKDLAEKQHYL